MGVSGTGKTTVGLLLAEELGWSFIDADDFHSAASREKMARGEPLDETDRAQWLRALHAAIVDWLAQQRNVVLACSALKKSHREQLRAGPAVEFVHLQGDFDLVQARLRKRRGHFMNPGLLQSQFDLLEEPAQAVTVSIAAAPDAIAREIRQKLKL